MMGLCYQFEVKGGSDGYLSRSTIIITMFKVHTIKHPTNCTQIGTGLFIE